MADQPKFDVDSARKAGYSDDEILQHLTQSRQFDVDGALKSGYTKQDVIDHLSGNPALPNAGLSVPSAPNIEMKESLAPKLVKGAASMLPVAGGIAGAIAGAPAFGAGGMVGGALGSAGGEAANLAIQRGIFGEGPDTFKDQAKDVGIAGLVGAASEIPGAISATTGNRILSRVAASQPKGQYGNAAHGLMDANPISFSPQGIVRGIRSKLSEVGDQLGNILGSKSSTAPVDSIIDNSRAELEALAGPSANVDPALRSVATRSLRRFDEVIGSAKHNVGITGSDATPRQLFDLQRELQKDAWLGNPGPVSEVLKHTFQNTYTDIGHTVRTLAPEADSLLSQLSNLHAAETAVKAYKPGRVASLAMTSALNPRTTAVLSPLVAGAAVEGQSKAKGIVGNLASELVP